MLCSKSNQWYFQQKQLSEIDFICICYYFFFCFLSDKPESWDGSRYETFRERHPWEARHSNFSQTTVGWHQADKPRHVQKVAGKIICTLVKNLVNYCISIYSTTNVNHSLPKLPITEYNLPKTFIIRYMETLGTFCCI